MKQLQIYVISQSKLLLLHLLSLFQKWQSHDKSNPKSNSIRMKFRKIILKHHKKVYLVYWSRALGKGIHLHDYEYFFKSFPMNLTNFELLLSWVRPHIRKTYIKKVFLKFRNIHKKTPLLESLLNNVAGLKSSNFFEKRLHHRYFPVNIAKFLR